MSTYVNHSTGLATGIFNTLYVHVCQKLSVYSYKLLTPVTDSSTGKGKGVAESIEFLKQALNNPANNKESKKEAGVFYVG